MGIVFRTMVGSHMWGMQHEGSDIDEFVCYAGSTKDLLSGRLSAPPDFSHEGADVSAHEAEKVVEQLLKGNVNFIWGVMSPIVVESDSIRGVMRAVGEEYSSRHEELKAIVRRNLSKNCYDSIHGLAVNNFKKYVESGKDTSEKRCNTIVRSVMFGVRILRGEGIMFAPVSGSTPERIKEVIGILDQAYKESRLPDKPKEEELRDWLYRVRLYNW